MGDPCSTTVTNTIMLSKLLSCTTRRTALSRLAEQTSASVGLWLLDSMKLQVSRTNGRELRVMNCPLTAVLTPPPVPAARHTVDLLQKAAPPRWAHTWWWLGTASRRLAANAVLFWVRHTSQEPSGLLRRSACKVGNSTGHSVPYGPDWGGQSGNRFPVGGELPAPVHTGSGAHPASYAVSTASFPEARRLGCGVNNPPPSSAEVWDSRTIPLLLSVLHDTWWTSPSSLHVSLSDCTAHHRRLMRHQQLLTREHPKAFSRHKRAFGTSTRSNHACVLTR